MIKSDAATRLACGILGLWLGSVLVSGVTAAVAFPTMKSLAPTVPGYHVPADEHFLIVAGAVAQRVFNIVGIVQIVCLALVVAVLLLARWRMPRPNPVGPWWWAGRIALAATACATIWALSVQMRLNDLIAAYWSAAQAGEAAAAAIARDQFRAYHPTSTRALSISAIMIVLTCILLAFRATTPTPASSATDHPSNPAP